jgi:hypothetical protein
MVNLDYKNDFVFENDFAALKQEELLLRKQEQPGDSELAKQTFRAKPEEEFQ